MLSRRVLAKKQIGYATRWLTHVSAIPPVGNDKCKMPDPSYGRPVPEYPLQARHPNWPKAVRIVEVGLRDGLQNEPVFVRTEDKLKLLNLLVDAGLKNIEATSFVSRRAIPQLADAAEIMAGIPDSAKEDVSFPVLVPNKEYFQKAMAAGAKEIAIFTSTSKTFVQNNMKGERSSINAAYRLLVEEAAIQGIKVRGYLSCVITCPYEGVSNPDDVARCAEEMMEWGCYEVSLGDTTGAGTPGSFRSLLYSVLQRLSPHQVAVHCHNTYGQALANILASLEMGVSTVDSSVAGLGGCPYAKGATGNVATEDVVFMLQGMEVDSGVDIFKLMEASRFISSTVLHREKNTSNVTQAFPISPMSH